MVWRAIVASHWLLGGGAALIVGGLYLFVYRSNETLKAVDELLFRFKDFPIFEVIDRPLMTVFNERTCQRAYSVRDIRERLDRERSDKSILASLKRLKRCGRAIETFWGWYSIRTAPTDVTQQ
jgi:hypothetical protein